MISKALVAGTSQRKLEELAKCPGVALTLVTPAYWHSVSLAQDQPEFCVCTLHGVKEPGKLYEQAKEIPTSWRSQYFPTSDDRPSRAHSHRFSCPRKTQVGHCASSPAACPNSAARQSWNGNADLRDDQRDRQTQPANFSSSYTPIYLLLTAYSRTDISSSQDRSLGSQEPWSASPRVGRSRLMELPEQ